MARPVCFQSSGAQLPTERKDGVATRITPCRIRAGVTVRQPDNQYLPTTSYIRHNNDTRYVLNEILASHSRGAESWSWPTVALYTQTLPTETSSIFRKSRTKENNRHLLQETPRVAVVALAAKNGTSWVRTSGCIAGLS